MSFVRGDISLPYGIPHVQPAYVVVSMKDVPQAKWPHFAHIFGAVSLTSVGKLY